MKREIEEARRGGRLKAGRAKNHQVPSWRREIKKKGLKAYEIDTRQRCE
jgi:hypothetical protein